MEKLSRDGEARATGFFRGPQRGIVSRPPTGLRPPLLELVVILKALTEIAGFALLGQGIVYAFARIAGTNPDKNIPYVILKTVTSPVFALTRLITPRFVLDEFIWALTPLVVFLLWLLFVYLKARLVLGGG